MSAAAKLAALEEIETLFAKGGQETYGEEVTQLDHALQCAAVAAAEGAAPALVAAALLHDVGHLLGVIDDSRGYHKHDRLGAEWLGRHFGPEVTEPVRLHVAAKRYLCAVEADYAGKLSEASTYSLSKQGGPMSSEETRAFEANPHHDAAVRLRRWDDLGKVVGIEVLPLEHYRTTLLALAKG